MCNDIAIILRCLDFEKALELDQKVFSERQASFGNEDTSTLTSQFAISRDLRMLGRIYEAHEMLVSVSSILIQKRSLSRQFQLVVGADLIVSLRRCGKYPEALAQAESISASTKPHSGANHRETLRTGTNIISDLRIAGRLQDARILGRTHRSGLSVDRRRGPSTKLGVDHPETQMITQYERMTRDIELMMD